MTGKVSNREITHFEMKNMKMLCGDDLQLPSSSRDIGNVTCKKCKDLYDSIVPGKILTKEFALEYIHKNLLNCFCSNCGSLATTHYEGEIICPEYDKYCSSGSNKTMDEKWKHPCRDGVYGDWGDLAVLQFLKSKFGIKEEEIKKKRKDKI